MKSKILFGVVLALMAIASIGLFSSAQSATPTDRGVDAAYGVIYSYDCDTDTVKSATDSAVIKSNWIIPSLQKGCLFVLVVPKITGTGNDSVNAQLAVKGYDNTGRYLYTYYSGDTCSDSTSYIFVLPVETPLAPADKYDIQFRGYTGAGTQAIFNRCKIYALKPFSRQY